MDWKKILLKDFGKLRDVLVKTQPSVVDLVGSVNKRARIDGLNINLVCGSSWGIHCGYFWG